MARNRVTPEGAARRDLAVQLRRQAFTFAEIGERLNVSAPRAYELYSEGLRAAPVANVEQHRIEANALIDVAISALLRITGDQDVSPRTRVEAWSSIRSWSERRARLLGLDAPRRIDATITEDDGRDAELRQMIDEAKAKILAERQNAENADDE